MKVMDKEKGFKVLENEGMEGKSKDLKKIME